MGHQHYLLIALSLFTLTAQAGDRWHHGDGLLPADQAFQLMPLEQRGKTLHAEWTIAPGYYLYRSRIHFEPAQPAQTKIGEAKFPQGEKIHDEHFGDVEIYRGGVLKADLPVSGPVQQLKITYQGCAEIGVCYPPQTRTVAVQTLP